MMKYSLACVLPNLGLKMMCLRLSNTLSFRSRLPRAQGSWITYIQYNILVTQISIITIMFVEANCSIMQQNARYLSDLDDCDYYI